jgi:hypothetical protein
MEVSTGYFAIVNVTPMCGVFLSWKMSEFLTMLVRFNLFIFILWWNVDPILGISVRRGELVICS